MATLDRYVDPGVVGGLGDGSSWENAYNSLNAFEAAQQQDLTDGGGDVMICHCRSSGTNPEDTAGMTISGWTTGSSNYLEILTESSETNGMHSGVWSDTKYRMVSGGTVVPIRINEEYVIIIGLQLDHTGTGVPTGGAVVYYNAVISPGLTMLSRNIIRHTGTGGSVWGIRHNDGSASSLIWNNIIYGFTATTSGGIWIDSCNSAIVSNNTIYNCTTGILYDTDGASLRNNLVISCSRNYDLTGATINTNDTTNITNGVISSDITFGRLWFEGTATATQANDLIDSNATFQTIGVQVGSIIRNCSDITFAYVIAVCSQTTLALSNDIMAINEHYIIYRNMYGVATFVNAGGEDFHLGSTDTAATGKGTDLSGDALHAFSTDIDGDTRS